MMNNNSCKVSYPILTPNDTRRTEQKAFQLGVPSLLLMEHAAMAVVDELEKALGGSCKGKQVLFLCGTGNNGGDGFAAARLFARRGGRAAVWMLNEPKTPDAKTNLQWLRLLPEVEIVNVTSVLEAGKSLDDLRRPYDAYVDALVGTGFRGKPPRKGSGQSSFPVSISA